MSIRRSPLLPTSALALPIVILAVCLNVPAAHGQSNTSSFSSDDVQVSVSSADRTSAKSAVRVYKHAYFSRTPAGMAARHRAAHSRVSSAKGSSSGIADDDFTQNPGDVTYQGGATVEFAKSHAVYFNPGGECTIASRWEIPSAFWTMLGKATSSTFWISMSDCMATIATRSAAERC